MPNPHENMAHVVQLVAPSEQYKESYLAGLRALQAEGWLLDQDEKGAEANFTAFVQKMLDEEQGVNLAPGRVAATTRWLIVDGVFAGRLSVRHGLNDFLRREGGHIGYDIVPEYRLRGFGTMMLTEGLKIAKARGINPVLLTVNENNAGSRKIIEKHGGKLEDVREMGEGKPRKMRFWIAQ